jgi:hypothetical protein
MFRTLFKKETLSLLPYDTDGADNNLISYMCACFICIILLMIGIKFLSCINKPLVLERGGETKGAGLHRGYRVAYQDAIINGR